jgi:hypothetical protein
MLWRSGSNVSKEGVMLQMLRRRSSRYPFGAGHCRIKTNGVRMKFSIMTKKEDSPNNDHLRI